MINNETVGKKRTGDSPQIEPHVDVARDKLAAAALGRTPECVLRL